MSVLSRFVAFTNRHPVVRGMISYATIWPTSCILQQTIAGKNVENYDWIQALRFSLYGGLFTAPTLYAWVRISTMIWPKTNLKTAVTKVSIVFLKFRGILTEMRAFKAVVEQMTYGPAAMACFFFGMSLMEGKSAEEAKQQLELKFWPSYKVRRLDTGQNFYTSS